MHNKKASRGCCPGRHVKRRLAARYFPALLGAVSSPLGPLTAVFGMGTGVTAPPKPPARKVSATRKALEGKSLLLQRRGCAASSFPLHAPLPRRMEGRRASPTAYQNASAERVAALAPCTCQPGSLPGAFRGLRLGRRLRGGLALRCFQRLSLRGVATRPCR